MTVAGAAIYHDFQGLSDLRTRAGNAPAEALGEVAAQFESLFVQMMLKAMREATIEGGLFQSNQMEVYQGMHDSQLALALSSQGGLGLAEVLVEDLGGARSAGERSAEMQPLPTQVLPPLHTLRPPSLTADPADAAVGATEPVGARPPARAAANDSVNWQPASPEDYIRGVWDHAVEAAGKLGVDPAVLVAQSALETGWGRKVVQASDGGSSYNLFGIKADSGWDGAAAAVRSLEFRDGVAALEKASFRVYDSLSNSFDDYVSFLQNNPRYQQALAKVADTRQFLTELQDAGYATDPHYADKIMGIVRQIDVGAVFGDLKVL